ncbi:MAG TPA: nitrate ABC transporter substrate-binding protein [Aurantimonas coralicida]|uniref:Nitrate ABC transporter substrate-binding protein n=2 Tax=root TaxID=1 RepID=A0A9C9NG64_9HYPH|nr:nitrate ABC transporter substrate-binding protein [Aurantimonas coralicida]HEU01490.1 nitrate ABC transporter substrate-binding protein [Aurantimonas coralicida]
MPRLDDIRAGYLPLLDSAVLLVAADKGFAEVRGVRLILNRETSWATIRDRMGIGQLDAAHMLAPMPIAASLGLGPLAVPMVAPFVLALGGNAVTVSNAVAERMATINPVMDGPAAAGQALRRTVEAARRDGRPPLRFAVVHRHSSHNYDLRYWLAASGIGPDRDIDITVVPPPLMPDALATGQIDGFCVGEPWSTIAVRRGAGHIVTSKAEIWRRGPEKVLGLSAHFAETRGEVLERLILALHDAAAWCEDSANRETLAALLAAKEHLNVPESALLPALEGRLETAPGKRRAIEGFVTFHGADANRPNQDHGQWLFRQMVRWGDATDSETARDRAAAVFSPASYDTALGPLGPNRDSKRRLSENDRPAGLYDVAEENPASN